MPPRPSSAITRYRPAISVPGMKRPSSGMEVVVRRETAEDAVRGRLVSEGGITTVSSPAAPAAAAKAPAISSAPQREHLPASSAALVPQVVHCNIANGGTHDYRAVRGVRERGLASPGGFEPPLSP